METQHASSTRLLYRVGIAVTIISITTIFGLQFAKPQKPLVQAASADEVILRWPHTSLPVPLRLVNFSTTRVWPNHIAQAVADWQKSGVPSITQKDAGSDECELVYGQINVCSFNQPNSNLISWSQRGAQANGYILFGQINFNDAYLLSDPTYGNAIWRNYITCYSLGFTLGLDHQVAPSSGGTSCMESTDLRNIANQQHPSNASLTALKSAYDQLDSDKTAFASMGTTSPNNTLIVPKSWGSLVSTSTDGTIKTYRADIGNGNTVYTTTLIDPTYTK